MNRVDVGVVTAIAATGVASVLATPLLGFWPIIGWVGGLCSLSAAGRLRERIEVSHREAEDQRKRK